MRRGESGDGVYQDDSAGSADDSSTVEETDQVCFEPLVQGESLLDNARCVVGSGPLGSSLGVTVAACGTSDARLRACDDHWIRWCDDVGGDVEACDQDDVALADFLAFDSRCSAIAPDVRGCSETYIDACDALDHIYFEDVPGLTGRCVPPDLELAKVALCCKTQYDNPTNTFGACESKAGLGANAFYNKCTQYRTLCTGSVSCSPMGDCTCAG